MSKGVLYVDHVHNNISCVQKGLYPLQTYRKCVYAYQICCMRTHVWAFKGVLFAYNMFYMRTKSFVRVHNSLYAYTMFRTSTIGYVRVQI